MKDIFQNSSPFFSARPIEPIESECSYTKHAQIITMILSSRKKKDRVDMIHNSGSRNKSWKCEQLSAYQANSINKYTK